MGFRVFRLFVWGCPPCAPTCAARACSCLPTGPGLSSAPSLMRCVAAAAAARMPHGSPCYGARVRRQGCSSSSAAAWEGVLRFWLHGNTTPRIVVTSPHRHSRPPPGAPWPCFCGRLPCFCGRLRAGTAAPMQQYQCRNLSPCVCVHSGFLHAAGLPASNGLPHDA